MSSLKLSVLLGAAALGLLSGCGPDYAYLEIGQLTNPPVSVSLTNQGFSVPVGIAVGITIQAIDDRGEPMDTDTPAELLSLNASVLGLSPGLEDSTYVAYGTGPGTTEIAVSVDGERVDHIPVTVMLQQPE